MMKPALTRLKFIFKHKTFKAIVLDKNDPNQLIVCQKDGEKRVKRHCPHQGADLLEGWIEEGKVVCPWHGCKIAPKTDKNFNHP